MKGGMGTDREQGNIEHGEATVKDIWGEKEKHGKWIPACPGVEPNHAAMAMVSCLFSWTSLLPASPLQQERSWHIAVVDDGLRRDGRKRAAVASAGARVLCVQRSEKFACCPTDHSGNLGSTFFVLGWTMFPVKGVWIPKYPPPCPKRDVDMLGCLVHHVFVAAYASTDDMGPETPEP